LKRQGKLNEAGIRKHDDAKGKAGPRAKTSAGWEVIRESRVHRGGRGEEPKAARLISNYDRTEISKTLGIGYQYVRHVLLRSGITGGLRRQVGPNANP
jgi:hypothetical protein